MNVSSLEITVGAPTPRLLLGPGPSPVSARVLQAAASPTLGHLDPQFLALLDDVNDRLRAVFGTRNELTFPISGTGSAGMEAALVNVLEPGDTAIIGVQGFFGQRMAKMAARMGADVVAVEAEWGRTLDPEQFRAALEHEKDVKVVALVHAGDNFDAVHCFAARDEHLAHATLGTVDDYFGHFRTPIAFMVA